MIKWEMGINWQEYSRVLWVLWVTKHLLCFIYLSISLFSFFFLKTWKTIVIEHVNRMEKIKCDKIAGYYFSWIS